MQGTKGNLTCRFHRVVFLRDGKPTSLTFLGQVAAMSFCATLHTRRKGRVEPVPDLENFVPPMEDVNKVFGEKTYCPRGSRLRTWFARRPRIQRPYPNFNKTVQFMPAQSAGFAHSFPEEKPTTIVELATHPSMDLAQAWATKRYGRWADGEWWPKEEKK